MSGRRNTQLHCEKTGCSYRSLIWNLLWMPSCKEALILDWILNVWIMKGCETKKFVKWLRKHWDLRLNRTCDFCPSCQAEKYWNVLLKEHSSICTCPVKTPCLLAITCYQILIYFYYEPNCEWTSCHMVRSLQFLSAFSFIMQHQSDMLINPGKC